MGLLFWLSWWPIWGLSWGLGYGLSFAISSIVLHVFLLAASRKIALTERIAWSLPRLAHHLFSQAHLWLALQLFLFSSLAFGLIWWLSYGLAYGLSDGPSYGLSVGLIYWVLLGIWNSFSQEVLDDRRRSIPNEGVKRSLRNGILLGLIAGVLCGLVAFLNTVLVPVLRIVLSEELMSYGLSYGPTKEKLRYGPMKVGLIDALSWLLNFVRDYWMSDALSRALIAALIATLIVWFATGGLAVSRHYLLRLLLARQGLLPWRTIRFLDEATRRILLYRDGGGYRFVHRLLFDYFADLAPSVAQQDANASSFGQGNGSGSESIEPPRMRRRQGDQR